MLPVGIKKSIRIYLDESYSTVAWQAVSYLELQTNEYY